MSIIPRSRRKVIQTLKAEIGRMLEVVMEEDDGMIMAWANAHNRINHWESPRKDGFYTETSNIYEINGREYVVMSRVEIVPKETYPKELKWWGDKDE